MSNSPVPGQREHFNDEVAPKLADELGFANRWNGDGWSGRTSDRLAYFADDERLLVVAGPQEDRYVDLALAIGLSYCGDRELVLLLPAGLEFPTRQRIPWLVERVRPRLVTHAGDKISDVEVLTREASLAAVREHANGDPSSELATAWTALHLGDHGTEIAELVEWATRQPILDAAHRQGERSWHFFGQRVLSIRRTSAGLEIRSGIHGSSDDAPRSTKLERAAVLPAEERAAIEVTVQQGIAARLDGKYRKPDEHWLQAVLRQQPSLVGIEQPALREVPAWRPAANPTSRWGRGYIDLVGIDGQGDVRVVETKLSTNRDDLLVLQGLDYYVWAAVYRDALRARLGAAEKSEITIHFVVGSTTDGALHVSPHAARHASLLDPEIPWRFQTVENWFGDAGPVEPKSMLLAPGVVPGADP